MALGEPDRARAVLSPFWRKEKLDPNDEAAIIKEFGGLIPVADHRFRMERMFYAERAVSAQRVAGLAGAKSLADAWTAVLKGDKNAGKLLDAVPSAQRSAGYLFAEARYLRRSDKFSEAAAIMLKAPTDKAALVDPDAWWIERRVLSRELVDAGDIKTAYRLAAAHSAESPSNAVDAEFHAGWYALRGLNDAQRGGETFRPHRRDRRRPDFAFARLLLARPHGRSRRTGRRKGLLSARRRLRHRILRPTRRGQRSARGGITVVYPAPSDADRQNFARREAVQAIRRLEDAGHAWRADILYRDLAEQLTSPGELALLAAMAEKRGNHFLALRVGKTAASRGIDIGALSHPIGAIPSSAKIGGAGEGARLCNRAAGKRIQCRRRLRRRRAWGCCNCCQARPRKSPSGPGCPIRSRG